MRPKRPPMWLRLIAGCFSFIFGLLILAQEDGSVSVGASLIAVGLLNFALAIDHATERRTNTKEETPP